MEPARVTLAGLEQLTQIDAPVRTTLAGLEQLIKITSPARTTLAGLEMLTRQATPQTPTITDVDQITGSSARAHGSDFVSFVGNGHAGRRWRVYKASNDELVHDSGFDPDDLLIHSFFGLTPFVLYYVTAQDEDDEGNVSLESNGFYFRAAADPGLKFPIADYVPIWQRNRAHPTWGHNLIGGWGVLGTTNPSLYGMAAQFGRYMGNPAALINWRQPPSLEGHRVVAGGVACSLEGGFKPWSLYDAEGAKVGVCALASGTCELDPQEAIWNLWLPGMPGEIKQGSDMCGVWAFVEWPILRSAYHPCGIKGYGYEDADLVVEVFLDGVRRRVFIEARTIPKEIIAAGLRSCDIFNYIFVLLDVRKDFDADPTGRTHRIRASWELELRDEPSDGWDIDETWVGGREESEPGAGDGGLPCGWGGLAGSRYTGGVATKLGGWSQWRGVLVQPYGDPGPCLPPPPEEIPEAEPLSLPATALVPCPAEEPGPHLQLHFGAADSAKVLQYGASAHDDGRPVVALVRPNPFAPFGWGGEAMHRNAYLAVTHRGDAVVQITPVLDGLKLEDEAKESLLVGTGVERTERLKITPSRPHGIPERQRFGVRGTAHTVEILAQDVCGAGLTLDGIELDMERLRERQPRVEYTQQILKYPTFIPPTSLFLGAAEDGRVMGYDEESGQDGGTAFSARVHGNYVAPDGIGGECIFTNLYLVLGRWNTVDVDLVLVPIVDNTELEPYTLALPAVSIPVLGEVHEVPLFQPFTRSGVERSRYHPRGALFTVRHDLDPVLDRFFVCQGIEVECEVVRETQAALT